MRNFSLWWHVIYYSMRSKFHHKIKSNLIICFTFYFCHFSIIYSNLWNLRFVWFRLNFLWLLLLLLLILTWNLSYEWYLIFPSAILISVIYFFVFLQIIIWLFGEMIFSISKLILVLNLFWLARVLTHTLILDILFDSRVFWLFLTRLSWSATAFGSISISLKAHIFRYPRCTFSLTAFWCIRRVIIICISRWITTYTIIGILSDDSFI